MNLMTQAISTQEPHFIIKSAIIFDQYLTLIVEKIISWACNFFDIVYDAIAYVLPPPEYEVINLFPTEAELKIPPQKEEPASILDKVKALRVDPTSPYTWGILGGLSVLSTMAVSAYQISCLVSQPSVFAGLSAVASTWTSLAVTEALVRTMRAEHPEPNSCRIPGSAEALRFNASAKQALLAAERVRYVLSRLPSKDGKGTFYERYLDCLKQSPQELLDIRNPQAAADQIIREGRCFGWTQLQLLRVSHNDAMTSKELSSFSEEEQTRVLTLQMLSNIAAQMARITDRTAYTRIIVPLKRGTPYALKYASRARGPVSYQLHLSSMPSIADHLSHNVHGIRKTVLTPRLPYSASIQEYRQKFQEALSHCNDPHKIISGTILLQGNKSSHAMWFQYSEGKMRFQDSFGSEGGIFDCHTQEQFFDVLHRLCLACGEYMGKETRVYFSVHEIERNGLEQSPQKH
jgi:hypothetical protein